MNKWIFAILVFFATASIATAQVVFSFSSDTIPDPGETIDVDVIVESGFTDIVSFQLSLNWDRTVFSYSSIQNITSVLPEFSDGNIGSPPDGPGVNDGELTLSWSRSSTQPASIPDGTRLFTLRLFGEGELCESTNLNISNSPVVVEIIDNDFNEVDVEESGGFLVIYNESCEGNNMGGGDEVLLNVGDISASGGTNICIPVTASNFANIGSLQAGVTWDSNVLSFTGINDGGLTAVTANSNNAANGELIVLWLFDRDEVTLADGSTLFELCFDVIGNTGQTTSVQIQDLPTLKIEIADIDGTSLDFAVDNGLFTVGSGGTEETGVGLIFPDVYTNGQSSLCVPVTTRDFINISAVQGGIAFDSTILRYAGVNDGVLQNVLIGDGQASSGELRLLWTVSLGSDAVTADDGDVLFELCFDVIGADGDRSPLSFFNLPFLPLEVVDDNAQAVDYFVRDGSVTIGDEPRKDVVLIASKHLADPGDTICVDISVEGFSDIDGMGFALRWDASIVMYVNQQNFNLTSLGNNTFNLENDSTLILLWAPTSSQSVADGTSIFEVCYNVIGDCSEDLKTAISFVDGNTPLEIVDKDQNTLSVELVNGEIAIDTCKGPSVNILSIVHPTCSGDQDGAISVDFNNTAGTVTCSWTDADGTEVSSNCNLLGVGGGTYTLNATDEEGVMLNRIIPIIDPGEIIATPIVTDISCDSPGALSLDVTGGTGSYTYSWTGGLPATNSQSPIDAGTYSVTITDSNNCTGTTSATVNDNSFDLDPVVMDVTGADNGSIDLQPGSSVDATYAWSNGETTSAISGLAVGTYTVTISDNNVSCMITLVFEVQDGELSSGDILIDINSTYNGFGISCNGESDGIISGTIGGGCSDGPLKAFVDGIEVTVGNDGTISVDGLEVGEHTLRIEDACGATVEETFTLTEPDAITVGEVTDIECPDEGMSNGSLRLPAEGGVGILTYSVLSGSVSSDGTISGISEGGFTVIIEDDNGCQLMVPNVGFGGACSDLPLECIGGSIITPNGDNVNEAFLIGCVAEGSNAPYNLSVFDRWGNPVYENSNYDNSWRGIHMNGTELPEGGYMWVLITGGPGQREIFRGTVSILR